MYGKHPGIGFLAQETRVHTALSALMITCTTDALTLNNFLTSLPSTWYTFPKTSTCNQLIVHATLEVAHHSPKRIDLHFSWKNSIINKYISFASVRTNNRIHAFAYYLFIWLNNSQEMHVSRVFVYLWTWPVSLEPVYLPGCQATFWCHEDLATPLTARRSFHWAVVKVAGSLNDKTWVSLQMGKPIPPCPQEPAHLSRKAGCVSDTRGNQLVCCRFW